MLEDILELYGLIIGSTATVAADHLRNRDGLESALARPATYAHYENADLALQAAVLAHGCARSSRPNTTIWCSRLWRRRAALRPLRARDRLRLG
ncbi:MAG TPA: hypothetical protein VID29_03095 [Solirubrobacteraceae bacterium]